ncbi:CFEM domain-containing protein [Colletotrichum eremochloae]|nr:CFEM domain-containing protein [Colletotrichum eremochloae]
MSTWGPDDTLATVAFFMIITLYGSSFYFISIGLGKEVWTLHDHEITTFFKLFLFLEWMYLGGLAVIKASILFFYLKIFPDRRFRRVLWTVQIINLLVCLTFIIVCLAQCRPFSYFWTSWDGEHEGTCLDLTWIGLTHVGMNIALDIVMLVLPVTQIYKLNMDMRKKIGVIAMFQAGIFLTVVSILRIRTLSKFALTANITADSVDVFLWAYVEMGVGLVVACMPSAWQLLKLIPSKVTQLTTAVVTNIGSSDNRTRPDSHVVPGKRSKMSVMETHSRRSNSIAMRPASSSKRLSDHDELKVGMAL